MKLFYAAGASSLAAHILLEESGLPYSLEKVNLDTKTWNHGDYVLINAKSYVPALQTENGMLLTECAVILEYIANTADTQGLLAPYASSAYWDQRMWLNYIATELHKNFISPVRPGNWLPNTQASQQLVYQRVLPRLKFVEHALEQQNYLSNQHFTAPDAYLFVMTNWFKRLGYPFGELKNLQAFDAHLRERPAIQRVLKQEGRPHSLQAKS
ncbi:glutathione S-transferase N-terminal domain-containing protein [Liquorilactobacillus satsumensis]|uniref:glutathione S-transferase N-terminal domain-containing protein n=1 Tax=Liquorilactobacillus satsumensis TaxID=259059 RepID=UPI0021C41E1B|nr:glutathione S-transferase N-terminal domain-containing protein [Liquorilactobacillus satsumensis]MCP9329246.1 glutathione S-transferase N-terminal domain-containing protein [Liquorilactobacillus satsumensis]